MNEAYQSGILMAWSGKVTTEALTRKTCPSATFDNPTQTGLESNTDLHSDMPATNCLKHDTAFTFVVL